MLVRPDLLENPDVQKRLELIIFRPHLLQVLIRKNPEFIEKFAEKLKGLIDSKVDAGREESAGFLMHIGDRLKAHAVAAKKCLDGARYGVVKDPYETMSKPLHTGQGQGSDRSVVYDFLSNKETKILREDILDNIPGFDTKYGKTGTSGVRLFEKVARWWSKSHSQQRPHD